MRKAVEEPASSHVSASALQQHPDARFVLDRAAAARLSRFESPWLVGPLDSMGLEWTAPLTRKAVIWLALSLGIPFLVGYWVGGGSIALGFECFIWAGLLRVFVFDHLTWSVNSICHMFGRRDFATDARATVVCVPPTSAART